MTEPPSQATQIVMPLHQEDLTVSRQRTERLVRVRVETTETIQPVDEPVLHEAVEIDRIPIGRPVDAVPPVRTEGEITIVPVVQEELVIQRRLVLKEEIHLRRVQRTERHRETVTLRQQRAVIERAGPEADGDCSPHAATGTPKEENPH